MKKIDSIIDEISGGATRKNTQDRNYEDSEKFIKKTKPSTIPNDQENTEPVIYNVRDEIDVAEIKKIDSLDEIYKC